jgi:predicted ABC-type exoprotein transport system permease subunit
MLYRLLATILAIVLTIAFLAPIVLKLRDGALGTVIVIGIVLIILDARASLRDKDS